MKSYYTERLSGARLRECYDIAPARTRRYLEEEIRFVLGRIQRVESVLELGCGYGRVTHEIAMAAPRVVGIDISADSIALARRLWAGQGSLEFLEMDAAKLEFPDAEFDRVVCVQNGICAFGVDPLRLVREALRVTRPGGEVLLSSYAEGFWRPRLRWFELQAARGLVGEIDYDRTGQGRIICKDGFISGTMGPAGFEELCARAEVRGTVTEVDGSSVFCVVEAPASR